MFYFSDSIKVHSNSRVSGRTTEFPSVAHTQTHNQNFYKQISSFALPHLAQSSQRSGQRWTLEPGRDFMHNAVELF